MTEYKQVLKQFLCCKSYSKHQ